MSIDQPLLPEFEDLFDSAPCGLVVTDEDGTILRSNRIFSIWIGISQEDLAQRRFQDLLTMGGRIFHQTHWAPLMRMQGSVAEVKLELKNASGHTVTTLLNGVRREHEQRAFFAEQMVAIASHDLKNPLTAIKMAADLLARGERTPRDTELLGHISQSSERAQRMIADLLDFALARVGRGIGITRRQVDLHLVFERSVKELRVAFPQAKLIHKQEGAGMAEVDADRMHQMIVNLVANSVAYGDPGHPITVTSTVQGETAMLSVHNEGTAIPESSLGNLFEPMTRVSELDTDLRSVGLGLFIVREIARAHGGDVAVSSTNETGTSFCVSFTRTGTAG